MNRRFIDGVKYLNTYLFLIFISVLGAQDETRYTVAILDFEWLDISIQKGLKMLRTMAYRTFLLRKC